MLKLIRVSLILVALVAVSTVALAQEDDESFFFELEPERIVARSAQPGWDYAHTAPGAIIFHDGQYHFFRNGYHPWPSPSQIGYMTSADGLNWQQVQTDPIFRREQVPFDVDLVLLSSVLIEEDGTWVFYFHTIPNENPDSPQGVMRATTDDPLNGEWEVDSELVFTPTGEDTWDASFVGPVEVIKAGDGDYRMFYGGANDDVTAVGIATSDDGITWERYAENPVLSPEMSWERTMLTDPSVVQTPDGWVMSYAGGFPSSFVSGANGFGLAHSEDGFTWERLYEEPVFTDEQVIRRRDMWFHKLFHHDDTYFLYLEINSPPGTDIFVAHRQGSVLPE